MGQPATRSELKQYCLRRLGDPVIQINVADEQVEDRIDDAIQYWNEYHTDGVAEVYMRHMITQADVDNRYIPIPDDICYVTELFSVNRRRGIDGLFDIEYQIHLNDLFDLSFSGGLVPYVQTRQYVDMLDDVFNGRPHFQYSRHSQKLGIEIDWGKEVVAGDYIVVKAVRFVDPSQTSNAYSSIWLKDYTTALIQQQWGLNLIKFNGIEMLGGVTIDGETILSKAEENITRLKEEMDMRYSEPVDFFIG